MFNVEYFVVVIVFVCQIILDIGWCSAKDLGVLLCNYLLYLGLKAWLVLGVAVPQGQTTFVLYKIGSESLPETYNLIDPCTGNQCTVTDVFCPLQRIYMVVATNNVRSLSILDLIGKIIINKIKNSYCFNRFT